MDVDHRPDEDPYAAYGSAPLAQPAKRPRGRPRKEILPSIGTPKNPATSARGIDDETLERYEELLAAFGSGPYYFNTEKGSFSVGWNDADEQTIWLGSVVAGDPAIVVSQGRLLTTAPGAMRKLIAEVRALHKTKPTVEIREVRVEVPAPAPEVPYDVEAARAMDRLKTQFNEARAERDRLQVELQRARVVVDLAIAWETAPDAEEDEAYESLSEALDTYAKRL